VKLNTRRKEFAQKLQALQRRTVDDLFEMGRVLIQAKAALPHGEWTALVTEDMHWNMNAAQRLMAVARHPTLSKTATLPLLPASREVLYKLAQLPEDCLKATLNNGDITPTTTLSDAQSLERDYYNSEAADLRHAALQDAIRELPPGAERRRLEKDARQFERGVAKYSKKTARPSGSEDEDDETPELTTPQWRKAWESGVMVGAEASLSALRDHPEFGTLADLIIQHVMGKLYASQFKEKREVSLRNLAKQYARKEAA
jgi:hypothetical protein